MWKLLARKRTYLGFGAFLLLELVIYGMYHLKGGDKWLSIVIRNNGGVFEQYNSPLTVAIIVVVFAIVLLGAIYLSLVAGDVVAKESEDGGLRLLLARPVSRLRLLSLKYASCVVYTVALVQFIVWSALALGCLLRSWGGGLFVFVPERQILSFFDAGEGLRRYATASVFLCLSMMTPTSLAFFFSCWRIKPATATISAMSYIFIDLVLRESHVMDSHKGWLVTHHMSAWALVFSEDIPWAKIIEHYTFLGGICLSLFVLGVLLFESRDVKS
jgi:ABC-2 type transport system permease protein